MKIQSFFVFMIISRIALFPGGPGRAEGEIPSPLTSLLPEVDSWSLSDPPRVFHPESLFEYINGAAEIYLNYDFKELLAAEYAREGGKASMVVEIYDMGNEKNAFGIYSVERYHDSRFIPVGTQGYSEEGMLNFLAGRYYVKLLCFDCSEGGEEALMLFARDVAGKIGDTGTFSPLVKIFPGEGLVPNSEKFFLRHFLGLGFLHNGYSAAYEHNGFEFECFLVEAGDEEEAKDMLEQFLEFYSRHGRPEEIPHGFRLFDRQSQNIYLGRAGNVLCGVTKIKEGFEKVGEKYLGMLVGSLRK